ncbi:endonuclease [Sulfitobacter sp. D35]|uniref:endonuclease/exonuclease/phosphatase family protein n=1 Tax=Sulfitobacter sp. D35 TaxID=3083252 RepID=UPI00296FE763|nr:endonuclease/exonuclease/phosphatase family protein [Sulfitobacter sp. D35]MDW4499560.1 endonuclease [Sulfitobacter sp. D35]
MRIATYNVEWFNALFDRNGRLFDDDGWSGRHEVTRRAQTAALGRVFRALDADGVLVVEAPDALHNRSTGMALENFAATFDLRARECVTGFTNDTQQEIAFLFDPDRLLPRHAPEPGHVDLPRFDGVFRIDLDIDATEDEVVFSKPPLELSVETSGGFAFNVIGAHLKSKAPHGARNPDQVMQLAIANRRKQLAQAVWLRARIERHLEAGTPLIVLGDLNDGPGLDEYENLFGRSSVEIVMGGENEPHLFDPHARLALSRRIGAAPTSARFWVEPEQRYLQALLDYVMVSQDFLTHGPRWRIWHPFDDPDCWEDADLRDALLTASDHFPVTLDIEI